MWLTSWVSSNGSSSREDVSGRTSRTSIVSISKTDLIVSVIFWAFISSNTLFTDCFCENAIKVLLQFSVNLLKKSLEKNFIFCEEWRYDKVRFLLIFISFTEWDTFSIVRKLKNNWLDS